MKLKVAMINPSVSQVGHNTRGIGSYVLNLSKELKLSKEIDFYTISDIKEAKDFDTIHYPYFDFTKQSFMVPENISVVVTIHDVIPLEYPKHYPMGVVAKLNFWGQKRALKKAKGVITDAVASINSIQGTLDVSEDKIKPIHLGVGEDFKEIKDSMILDNVSRKYKLPKNFILYVGDVNWNKNLPNIAESAIKAQVNIVFVGKGFETQPHQKHKELEAYNEFCLKYRENEFIHVLGYVESGDLPVVYNLAKSLVLLSFAEGFGLPILESQSCGTRVLASDIPVLREVAGEGAEFVDPENILDITRAMRRLIDDRKFNLDISKKGLVNSQRFSWRKCAEETIRYYIECTNKNFTKI